MLTLLEPSSPDSSDHPLQDEISPVGSSRAISRSSDVPPVTSTQEAPTHEMVETIESPQGRAISRSSDTPPVTSTQGAPAQENVDTVESPQGRSILKRWLQRMGNKSPSSHKPDRRSGRPREPVDRRSHSHSPPRMDNRQEGPSRMAASRPKTVSLFPDRRSDVVC